MDWPYHFPHPADVIACEAERFRRLSPEERLREIVGLVAVAHRLLEASPNRAAIEAQIEASERAWQQAHQQVFERMATDTTSDTPRLLAGLAALTDAFDRHGICYALVGGLAVGFYARSSFTNAIEVLLTVPQVTLPGLVGDLAAHGFTLDERTVVEEFVRHHLTKFEYRGVRVDWLKPVVPLYQHTLDRAAPQRLDNRELRVATPEGLILLKLITSHAQDVADIAALLGANQGRLDLAWVEQEWLTAFSTDDPRWIRFRQAVAANYDSPASL